MDSSISAPSRASATHRARTWIAGRIGALVGAALLGCVLLTAQAMAQTGAPPPPPPGAPPPPGTAIYSAAQLDQMLAPIALYPDDLLGQILIAATYPLEIVQANRWLQRPENAALRGPELTQALQQLPWDPSIKSLVPYPQVLSFMDSSLDWTEGVGDAFLAQQSDVMDSVQRLRSLAQANGSLSSTPQEAVTTDNQAIQIASPDPSVEYVPVYDPESAYGSWPYPDYPPYNAYLPGYGFGTYVVFPILVPYWGWDHWDWRHHRIDVDNGVGEPHREPRRPVPWHHDPAHRGGIPYRDPGSRTRFEGGQDNHSAGGNHRGYPARPEAAPSDGRAARSAPPPATGRTPIAERPAPPPVASRSSVPERSMPSAPEVRRPVPAMPRPEAPRPAPQMARPEAPRSAPPMPRPEAPRPMPVIERPMPPAMESFGRGPQVQAQEMRGISSRAAPPAPPPPQTSAPAARGRR
jgi:hypothetical protein